MFQKFKPRILSVSLILLLSVALFFCGTDRKPVVVTYDNPAIAHMGRVIKDSEAMLLFWSGTSVSITFEGAEIIATLKDEKGLNYFNVIVDDVCTHIIRTDTDKKAYILATNLKSGRHIVSLFKRTEGTMGNTRFYGFELPAGTRVLPAKRNKLKMEFYGNSITSGFSIEDAIGDSKSAQFFNNYLSYAALTARHYNADYYCISKSGIGLLVSWFPVIMPELFDRVDPENDSLKWDFNSYTPDIVVINLMQNDSWLVKMPAHPQFKARFGSVPPDEQTIIRAYQRFVASIRGKYPNASIICALGSMDATKEGSPWPGYIVSAVKEMNDKKVYTFFFPFKNATGHPKVKDHQIMADSLVSFIDKNISW